MLFPNKISHCILLLAIGLLFSGLSLFVYQKAYAELLSMSILCISVVIPSFLINKKKKYALKINNTFDYKKLIGQNKLFFLLLCVYLMLSLAFSSFMNERSNDSHITLRIALGAIVIGPMIEEVIFRFTFLNGLLERYALSKAVVVDSLLFALIHYNVIGTLSENLHSIINAFILSLFLGYIFAKSKNLVYVILLHCIINTLMLLC